MKKDSPSSLKVGTVLAGLLATSAGIWLAISIGTSNWLHVLLALCLYGAAYWMHYVAVNGDVV